MPDAIPKLRDVPLLGIVIPCYNEEETLPHTLDRISELLTQCKATGQIKPESFACYVDDGSHDSTWSILEGRHEVDPYCRAVKFAANAGHQNAVWAGMGMCRQWGVDCIISLDADLQDDIGVVPQMLTQYAGGCEIVYGVRNSRATDTAFKRDSAHLFYALMRKINVTIIPDHADYRLVGAPVLDALKSYGEQNLFLRGLFPLLGFKTGKVYYRRLSRQAGTSKYPLRKMLSFAWQGITSCSTAPLRMASMLSLLGVLVALAGSVIALVKYAYGVAVPGWTSLMIVCLFMGSAQLLCLAIIGEYIAKIYVESRHRPRYIIEKCLVGTDFSPPAPGDAKKFA